jgi:FkbM family methyltransferase
MYVRDSYLGGGLLRVQDGDTVVDLGANMGNFANLALSSGNTVRVVAVEPSLAMNTSFRRSVGLNSGYMPRVNLIRAFLVGIPQTVQCVIAQDVNYHGAPRMSEADLIKEGHLTKVDFLKCDIEGGEFQLLTADSKLLAMTQSIAIEVHAFAGDVHEFIERLRRCGFGIVAAKYDPDGTATVLGKR